MVLDFLIEYTITAEHNHLELANRVKGISICGRGNGSNEEDSEGRIRKRKIISINIIHHRMGEWKTVFPNRKMWSD